MFLVSESKAVHKWIVDNQVDAKVVLTSDDSGEEVQLCYTYERTVNGVDSKMELIAHSKDVNDGSVACETPAFFLCKWLNAYQIYGDLLDVSYAEVVNEGIPGVNTEEDAIRYLNWLEDFFEQSTAFMGKDADRSAFYDPRLMIFDIG